MAALKTRTKSLSYLRLKNYERWIKTDADTEKHDELRIGLS